MQKTFKRESFDSLSLKNLSLNDQSSALEPQGLRSRAEGLRLPKTEPSEAGRFWRGRTNVTERMPAVRRVQRSVACSDEC